MTSVSNIARVQILSVNDFHGQLADSDAEVDGVKIGGAATLAAYVNRERAKHPNATMFVSAGDMVGAAPPESTLLKHHSSVAALAAMGLDLATFGNHEFDKGYDEAIRLIYGDDYVNKRKRGAGAKVDAVSGAKQIAAARGKDKWPGSPFPWVSANVVHKGTNKPVLPPYVIKEINGVKVAFIGAVTKNLKDVTVASGIQNIEAQDPAKAINRYIPEIQAKGVKAIVAVIHEGGHTDKKNKGKLSGDIVNVIKRLHSEVDAVISGHSHQEYVTQINGRHVIQAGSYAKALGVLQLDVDRRSGQVVKTRAKLVRNDEDGIQPDPVVDKMVKGFQKAIAPQTERVITKIAAPITRKFNKSGETALGSLIAEAQRVYAKADIAFMNNGGVRQDLESAGEIKWGMLFGVQPFGNRVIKMKMTGAEVMAVLEQQFGADGRVEIIQVAGMKVYLNTTKPVGQRVTRVVMNDGKPLDPKREYTVAANNFIAEGGDGFEAMKKGRDRKDLGDDLQALVKYLEKTKEVPTKQPGRIILEAGKLGRSGH